MRRNTAVNVSGDGRISEACAERTDRLREADTLSRDADPTIAELSKAGDLLIVYFGVLFVGVFYYLSGRGKDMMKGNRKRLFSLFLALVMLLSLSPVSAFAAADTEQKVKVECDAPGANVRVYEKQRNGEYNEVLSSGDHYYHILPGEYYYTAEAAGYSDVDYTPFTVTDGDGQVVYVTMTPVAPAGPSEPGDGTGENLENPDAQGDGEDTAPGLQDLIKEDPKVTNTVTLSLEKLEKDEAGKEKKHEYIRVQVTGGEYPKTDKAPLQAAGAG